MGIPSGITNSNNKPKLETSPPPTSATSTTVNNNGTNGRSLHHHNHSHASPFIRRDRYKRNFLKVRKSLKDHPKKSFIKKEDPDQLATEEERLLGVEIATNGRIKEEEEDLTNEEFNEFPLRAVHKEDLENMRTHLLKFQSKKKIDPKNSFHLPIRLHRKDTRNLQFQLTRAEIVQRQKEIAEFKRRQEHEKAKLMGSGGSKRFGNASVNGSNAASSSSRANAKKSVTNTAATAPSTTTATTNSKQATPAPAASREPSASDTKATGTNTAAPSTNGGDAPVPIITKLEEAGISEHPENVGMVTYDGKMEPPEEDTAEQATVDPMADVAPDGGGRVKRTHLKRKTRQLKVLDENAKKLRFEEFYPWVMEDYDGYNTWVGSYEAGNSDSYVLLTVEDDGSFTMIPADKVYKFTARNKYATLTIDEAEKRMDKKNGEVPRWLMKHLDNIGTTTTRYDRTRRRLKAVADQRSAGGDDEEEEHDDNSEVELDYDEEFADDEEAPIIDGNEQENKESEQRLKKEMLQANAMGLRDEQDLPEEDKDEADKKIDEEGERIKKALQKTELAALYSSDEDDINPYLSDSDLEEEEEKKPEVKDEPSEEKDKEKLQAAGDESTEVPSVVKKEEPQEPTLPAPRISVKSIDNCVLIFKCDPSILENLPQGEWNQGSSKKRVLEAGGSVPSDGISPGGPQSPDKKVKSENDETLSVPLITEEDIIEAIGDAKVNVKEFGRAIRKKYPGQENKKRMFAIVKKLCRKVDNEHMELKKK